MARTQPTVERVRTWVLLALGVFLAVWQTVFEDEAQYWVLILAGGCLGLPAALGLDRAVQGAIKVSPPDETKEPAK